MQSYEAIGTTLEEFSTRIKLKTEKWAKVTPGSQHQGAVGAPIPHVRFTMSRYAKLNIPEVCSGSRPTKLKVSRTSPLDRQ